jgi:hypothetical protein
VIEALRVELKDWKCYNGMNVRKKGKLTLHEKHIVSKRKEMVAVATPLEHHNE